jgi:hypothetical protein
MTFRPRRGAAPIEARRVGRGHLIGDTEALTVAALVGANSSRCVGSCFRTFPMCSSRSERN